MSFILKIALIAGAVLTLANPVDIVLEERDAPHPLGINQGMVFNDSLTFTTYPTENCKGGTSVIYAGNYGLYDPQSMRSYSLSRQLAELETLQFFSGPGPYNPANNNNYAEQCVQLSATAGLNATNAKDRTDETQKGCHTLKQLQWCAIIWQGTVSG